MGCSSSEEDLKCRSLYRYMHKIFISTLVVFVVVLSVVHAEDLPRQQSPYVNDFAGIFNASDIEGLRALLQGVEQSTTAQVFLVMVATTAPDTPQEYRTKLFKAWGVGQKGKDNGLLIVYAVQEKRIEVEVGYGLEGLLPDSKVGRMLDETYVPLRDSGNVNGGIVAFTQAVSKVIEDNKEDVVAGKTTPKNSPVAVVIFILIFVGIVFLMHVMSKNARKGRGGSGIGWILWAILAGSGRGGGGSGFGGGGGFGGGFGGGGGSGGGGVGR